MVDPAPARTADTVAVEDIVVSLRFWAGQYATHYEECPHHGCLTCLFVEDMHRAIAEIERCRGEQSDGLAGDGP